MSIRFDFHFLYYQPHNFVQMKNFQGVTYPRILRIQQSYLQANLFANLSFHIGGTLCIGRNLKGAQQCLSIHVGSSKIDKKVHELFNLTRNGFEARVH